MSAAITKIEKELILGIWYKYINKNISISNFYFNSGNLIKFNFFYNYKLINYKKSFIGLCIKKKYNKYKTTLKLIVLLHKYKIIYNFIFTIPLLKNLELVSLYKNKIKNYKKPNLKNSKLYFLKLLSLKVLEKKINLVQN